MSTEKAATTKPDYQPTITSKLLKPNKGIGAIISAFDDEGRRVDLPVATMDPDDDHIYRVHLRAVRQFCKVFGLEGRLVVGQTGLRTWVWNWDDEVMSEHIDIEDPIEPESICYATVVSHDELMEMERDQVVN